MLTIEWIIVYTLLGLILTLLVVLLWQQYKIKNMNKADQIVKDLEVFLKLNTQENNSQLIENLLFRIAATEEKQQKNLYESRIEMLEKLSTTSSELSDAFLRLQNNIGLNINNANMRMNDSINHYFSQLNSRLEENLDKMNKRVDMRLNEGFEKTNQTFNNIIERLSKIDEAQKKIDHLSTDIVSLQAVLTDKKSRGTFGEVQLNMILKSIFGDKNDRIFELQKQMPNQTIVDAVIHVPDPVGMIPIDSKFPLENYQKMLDRALTELERNRHEKLFRGNLKKHIQDISDKYIIEGYTSEQAIMFLPAEAIFAEINAYHQDLIEFAREKKVWLTSPTTLMSVLSTIQIVLKNMERDQYTHIIHEELKKLGQEFSRYQERWNALAKDIDKVTKDVKDIHITSGKIGNRFNQISNVEIEDPIEIES